MIKRFRRVIGLVTMILMVISLVIPATGFAADAVNIAVDTENLIDIVLSAGDIDVDLTTFDTDLRAALVNAGIASSKIGTVSIQALETTDVAAGDTTAGWLTYDHTNTNTTPPIVPHYKPYYNETNIGS